MNKYRVGVLMGGRSIEKEVSFNSGRTICDHLDTAHYEIIPLFQRDNGKLYRLPWRFLHRGKISDFEHRLESEAEAISWDHLKEIVDFIYIATHGRYAEDGTLQGFLEILGIPYLGSKVMASALGMDKIFQKKIMAAAGIDVPAGIHVTPHELTELQKDPNLVPELLKKNSLKLPCLVKPYFEGSSLGISVVFNEQELLQALIHASTIHPSKTQTVLLEEYITGMEFTCITITDPKTGNLISLPPTEVVPEEHSLFFDYEQKYMPGRATKYTPARCTPEITQRIQEECTKVMKVLGFTNLSRIDGFVTPDGRIVIIDPNSLSGMAPSSFLFRQAAEMNMSHSQFINHLITTELISYHLYDSLSSMNTITNSTNHTRLRVAVLLGGASHEKEISLESGRNVVYKLSPHDYEAIPVFVDNNLNLHKINHQLLVRHSTQEISDGLTPDMKIGWSNLPDIADFVFIGLHGGKGENGCVQGALEMLGLPYNGSSVLTSSLCMDKFKTCEYLRINGLDVPNNILVSEKTWAHDQQKVLKNLGKALTFPLIVKPHDDGCSVLVYKTHTEQELIKAIESIFTDGKKFALVEEFIAGMELTVGVMGNDVIKALPPSRAVTSGGILSIEEKFLPGAGENQTPAPLPEPTLELVQRTMEKAYKILNCRGYVRIDCFYQPAELSPTKKERAVILEVNSLPGLTPATCIFHQAAEINMRPMDFIDAIIKLGLEEHAIKKPTRVAEQDLCIPLKETARQPEI